jgi:hypothetical protein
MGIDHTDWTIDHGLHVRLDHFRYLALLSFAPKGMTREPTET